MNSKWLDFKHKEVIDITTGKRLGYVLDVNADLGSGVISSIIVPGNNKILNLFPGDKIMTIPWSKIKIIGEDLILVET